MPIFFFLLRQYKALIVTVLMAITLTAVIVSLVQTNNIVDKQKVQIAEQGKQIESLQDKLHEADNVISDMQAENGELKGDLDSLQDENDVLRDEIIALKKKISIAEQEKKATLTAASSTLKVKASAYVGNCSEGCSGFTATGLDVRHSTPKIIAVDPRVIPLGTVVELIVDGKSWGKYTASDTGGAIRGKKIDVLMKTEKECRNFGVRTVELKIVKKPDAI